MCSSDLLSVGNWHVTENLMLYLVGLVGQVLVIGVKLAAPVMISLLATTVVLGVMARAFPQMNVFMISMPLNIGLGLIILGSTLLIFFHVLEVAFGQLKGQVGTLLRLMAKGG